MRTFSAWVRGHRKAVHSLKGLVAITTITSVVNAFGWARDTIDESLFELLWLGLHWLVTVALLVATLCVQKRLPDYHRSPTLASRQLGGLVDESSSVRDFYRYILYFWCLWIVMYGALFARALHKVRTSEESSLALGVVSSIEEVRQQRQVTVMAAQFLPPLGLTFAHPAVSRDVDALLEIVQSPGRAAHLAHALRVAARASAQASHYSADTQARAPDIEKAFGRFEEYKENPWWRVLLNVLNNVQAVVGVLCFWALAFPRNLAAMVGILAAGFIATLSSVLGSWYEPTAMEAVGGVMGGVSLALIVGRLDSKYLSVPPWAIVSLYSYAVLQGAWFVFFDDHLTWFIIVTGLAMALKVVFYLVTTWLLADGELLYCFYEMRVILGLTKEGRKKTMYSHRAVADRAETFRSLLESRE